MKTHNSKRAVRIWIEAAIVGVCVAITAVLLQYIIGKESWLMRLLLLVGAALALCLVQFIISSWMRPRAAEGMADPSAPEKSERHQ